ncbi:MAG: OmpA family protein [Bacteroidetes bacterium]|nr:OmpA family protein [Bacteroidota bacterium]
MLLLFNSLSAQVVEQNQEISSKLTQTFTPNYKEYSPNDSVRSPSVKLGNIQDRKLIFYDEFLDNRHCWSHFQSTNDTLLSECNGFADRKVCLSTPDKLVDSYTNMEDGKKVLFAFTPDSRLKYSNNVPIPLAKNYVVTFNPLSIKQVSKLPTFYYESFCEHSIRIHNNLKKRDLIIETKIETAIGSWGLFFGDLLSNNACYYFRVNPNNTFELSTIYPADRKSPATILSGSLPMNFETVKKLAIELEFKGGQGYKIELKANDVEVGKMNVSKLIVGSVDIGLRLDHTSIDGNNILVCDNIAVYEKVKPMYLPESVNFSGEWTGGLYRRKQKIYHVKLSLKENAQGIIDGRIVYEHTKFNGTRIVKNFKASRQKHIINFEDRALEANGVYNEVVRYSLLQMGHFEVIDPDSIILNSFSTSNLHKLSHFDSEFDLHSTDIYLSRVEKTINPDEILIDPDNENPSVEVSILFKPDSWEMSGDKENEENLDALARSLHRYLAMNSDKIILIHGHTDLGFAEMLSLVRANTIKGELLKRGIPPIIFCIGHGNSARVGPHGDPRNRRVEVEVLSIDSAKFVGESIVMKGPTTTFLLKNLPEQFELQIDFKQDTAKHFLLLKNESGGVYKYELPNTEGGKRQSLRVIKREDPETGMIMEYWHQGVRLRRETAGKFEQAGFESLGGKLEIENLVIFAPK